MTIEIKPISIAAVTRANYRMNHNFVRGFRFDVPGLGETVVFQAEYSAT